MVTKSANESANWKPVPANSKPSRGSLIRVAGETLPLGTVIKIIGDQIKYKTSKNRIAEISLGSELEVKVDGGSSAGAIKGSDVATKASEKGGKPKELKEKEKAKNSKPAAKKPGPLDEYDEEMATKEKDMDEDIEEEEPEELDEDEDIEEEEDDTEEEEEIKVSKASKTDKVSKTKPASSSASSNASSAWYSIEKVASLANVPTTRVAKLNREGAFEGHTRPDTDARGPGRKPLLFSSAVLDIIAALPTPTRGKPGRKPGSGKDEPNVQQTSIGFDQDDAKKRAAEERAKAKKMSSAKESSAAAPSNSGGLGAILFHLDATILETRMQINRLHAALEGLEAQRGVLVSIAE